MTIQKLAEEYHALFVLGKRGDGTEYWHIPREERTPELTELCHKAHGDMLPDDWRYSFIVEALALISESANPRDERLEADIYTHELTSWLHSRADRHGYCDEFRDEFGEPDNTFNLLQGGQYMEKQEVYHSVLSSLESMLEDEEEEDEEESEESEEDEEGEQS
jgi:hypothetical protein